MLHPRQHCHQETYSCSCWGRQEAVLHPRLRPMPATPCRHAHRVHHKHVLLSKTLSAGLLRIAPPYLVSRTTPWSRQSAGRQGAGGGAAARSESGCAKPIHFTSLCTPPPPPASRHINHKRASRPAAQTRQCRTLAAGPWPLAGCQAAGGGAAEVRSAATANINITSACHTTDEGQSHQIQECRCTRQWGGRDGTTSPPLQLHHPAPAPPAMPD